jgi:hypothetical protein
MAGIASFGYGGTDPRVYYAAADFRVIELAWTGRWGFRDLTSETGAPLSSISPCDITCLGIGGRDPRVYYSAVDAQIIELAWTGRWQQSSITARAGSAPIEGFTLTSFGADGVNPRVYGVQRGDVIELAWMGGWTHRNLTAITAAPKVRDGTALTSFGFDVEIFGAGGPDGRIYYRSDDWHVHELAWTVESSVDPEGTWVDNDLSAIAGAPAGPSGDITCVGVGGIEGEFAPSPHIYYLDGAQHVNEIGWAGAWYHSDVSAAAQASPAETVNLACFAANGSEPRVYYEDGHVNELAWDGKEWRHTDLTSAAGGPSPVGLEPMACFAIDGSVARVYYVTESDGHVHELAWVGRWISSDLTAITGAPSLPHR